MQDTTIIYQGGSGGFLLYYSMLLTGKYTTGLPTTNYQKLFQDQFPSSLATDRSKWKLTEHWPDNLLCKKDIADKPRLFLFCNPLFNSKSDQFIIDIAKNTKIILLYTDLHTQLRLAFDKNAYWFTELGASRFNPENLPKKHYIKNILRAGVHWREDLCDPALPIIEQVYSVAEYIKLQDLMLDDTALTSHWLSLQSSKARRLL
jgi:hypothetical protein